MKAILVFLVITLPFISRSQSDFCEGWNVGFKQGWCYGTAFGCMAPMVPMCPMPNYGETSYADGYNRGFLAGRDSRQPQVQEGYHDSDRIISTDAVGGELVIPSSSPAFITPAPSPSQYSYQYEDPAVIPPHTATRSQHHADNAHPNNIAGGTQSRGPNDNKSGTAPGVTRSPKTGMVKRSVNGADIRRLIREGERKVLGFNRERKQITERYLKLTR